MVLVSVAHNANQYAARYAGAEGIVRRELTVAVNRTGLQGVARAQSLAAVKTGHMRRSIALKSAAPTGSAITASYGPNAWNNGFPYPVAVEKGRRGFSARRGRYLRFVINGRVIFARSVGPARAQPFMRPSAQHARAILPREMRAAVARIRARLGVG
jgi:hypothetical protein